MKKKPNWNGIIFLKKFVLGFRYISLLPSLSLFLKRFDLDQKQSELHQTDRSDCLFISSRIPDNIDRWITKQNKTLFFDSLFISLKRNWWLTCNKLIQMCSRIFIDTFFALIGINDQHWSPMSECFRWKPFLMTLMQLFQIIDCNRFFFGSIAFSNSFETGWWLGTKIN